MHRHNLLPPIDLVPEESREKPPPHPAPRIRKRRRSSSPHSDSSSPFHCAPFRPPTSYRHRALVDYPNPDTSPSLDREPAQSADVAYCYPSPPPTGSRQKRSVPLPPSQCSIRSGACASNIESADCEFHCQPSLAMDLAPVTPPSPPPTIPTPTLDLPSPDPPSSDLPHNSAHPSTDDGQAAGSDDADQECQSSPQLLSPLSPDWDLQKKMPDTSDASNSQSVLLSGPASASEDDGALSQPIASRPDSTTSWSSWPAVHGYPGDSSAIDDEYAAPRPLLSFLDIPPGHGDSASLWHSDNGILNGDLVDDRMDVDCSKSQFNDNDDDDMDVENDSHNHANIFWPLSASTTSTLPELEEDGLFDSPPSPFMQDLCDLPFDEPDSPLALRSCKNLPLGMEDEHDEYSRSPSGSILSLPGADTDEDLIPTELGLPKYDPLSTVMFSSPSRSSLLLLDDVTDLPPPRSPSPDHLDIDPALLEENPDLQRLCVLRKKSQTHERSLRQLEIQMLEQGQVHARANVRRERKKHKERTKEITALIKLKLGEHVFADAIGEDATGHPSTKKTISNLAQLVARMMFKRRERFRPLAYRKPVTSLDGGYVRSSLSRSLSSDEVEVEDGDEDFHMLSF